MGIREKVDAAIEFEVSTAMSSDQILAVTEATAEASKRMLSASFKVEALNEGVVAIKAHGPGGLLEWMSMRLECVPLHSTEVRAVRLVVVTFRTNQQTILFIPIAPKSAPAMTAAKRFSSSLRQALV